MTKRQITVIIVTFNSEKYIEKCIKSVIGAIPENFASRIIILDNNSSDNTTSIVNTMIVKLQGVEFIENKQNFGFAKAINIGIKNAQGSDYFLLLNPDTVSNKLSIVNLLKCAQEKNSGITGGSTFGADGKENGSFFRFPNLRIGIYDFTNIRKFDRSDKWHRNFYYLDMDFRNRQCFPVDVVTGGYMLISSKTVKKIGFFDERYFMYLEDVDYCYRATKAGVKIFHCIEAKIIHYSGRSSKNKDRIRHISWILSRKKYFIKHFNLIINMIIQPLFIFDDLIILTRKFLK